MLQEIEDERFLSGIITIHKMAQIITGINKCHDNAMGNKLTRIYSPQRAVVKEKKKKKKHEF